MPARGGGAAGPPALPRELHIRIAGKIDIDFHEDVWILSYDAVSNTPARLTWEKQSIEALGLVFFRREMAVYAEGSVRLRRPGMLLRAGSLYYNLAAGRGSATNVRLHASRGLLRELFPDRPEIRDVELAHTRIEQIILSAGEVTWSAPRTGAQGKTVPGRLQARDVRLTTCDFAEPHWYVQGRRVEAEFTDQGFTALRSSGNKLVVGGKTLLKLPRIGQDLKRPGRISALELSARNSTEWGATVFSHVGFDFGGALAGEPSRPFALGTLGMDFDYREKRGPAETLETSYRTASSGYGRLRYTYLNESLIPSGDDDARAVVNQLRFQTNAFRQRGKIEGTPLRLYEENILYEQRHAAQISSPPPGPLTLYSDLSRFALEYEHRSTWFEDPGEFADRRLDLDLELHAFRDRDYRQEYEEDAFKRGKVPETLAALRYQTADLVVELAGSWRVNEFFSRTEYLPEARLAVPGRPIGGGFLLNASLAAGRLRRRFDELEKIPDIAANRLHTYVQLSRPTRLGPLRFNGFIATQQTYYDDSYAGEAFWQGALLYAMELSTQLYGTFPVHKSGSDIAGYRHVIRPRVRFLNVSEPTHDPADVFDFDPIDDINEQDLLTFSLDQKLQVKRVNPRTRAHEVRDVASLELALDMFTEDGVAMRLNGGNDFDVLRVAAVVSPSAHLDLHANLLWSLHGDGVEEAVGGVALRGADNGWRAGLTARSTRDLLSERGVPGSTQLALRLESPLSRNWRLGVLTRFELEEPPSSASGLPARGLTDARVVLTRVFHDWVLAVRVGIDEAEDDQSVSLSIHPRGTAANLRKAAADLVEVGMPHTDGPFWGAP